MFRYIFRWKNNEILSSKDDTCHASYSYIISIDRCGINMSSSKIGFGEISRHAILGSSAGTFGLSWNMSTSF